jgi:hypothetical protein
MGTYSKSQQRILDQRPIEKPIVWAMGDREIVDTFDMHSQWDEDASTERLIQMTADSCSVSYARVVAALCTKGK